MSNIFNVDDRQNVLDYILSAAKDFAKIVSLVQVGSGAKGFNDERSDLDFVIAIDSNESMAEVMDYIHKKVSEKYTLSFFSQSPERHLQVYVLDNLLEIDIGYGYYEHAAALKPAFKVLFDKSGIVEDKMVRSRVGMDERVYGKKQEEDLKIAYDFALIHLMHAAVAIKRNNFLRTIGELDFVRKIYVDLLGDRYRLESTLYREMDKLPDYEKDAIKSTFVIDESQEHLWACLMNLTDLIYKELDGNNMPVSKYILFEYYRDLNK